MFVFVVAGADFNSAYMSTIMQYYPGKLVLIFKKYKSKQRTLKGANTKFNPYKTPSLLPTFRPSLLFLLSLCASVPPSIVFPDLFFFNHFNYNMIKLTYSSIFIKAGQ